MLGDVSQASSKNSSDNEGTYNSGYEIWHITSGIDSDSSEHQGSSQGSNGRYRQATAIGRYCQATSNSMTSKKHKMVAEGRAATDRAFEKLRQDVGVGVSSGDNNKDNDEEEENMRTVPDTPENRVNGSLAAKSPQQRVGGAPRKREAKIAPDPSASTPLPKLSFHSSPQCLGSQALYVKGSPHIEPPPLLAEQERHCHCGLGEYALPFRMLESDFPSPRCTVQRRQRLGRNMRWQPHLVIV